MTSSTDETTVFIDTNLSTNLAFIVPDSVTVSDLKSRIVLEHYQCFPAIGNIKIDGLKVKRRGKLYHLADWMRVKGAFAATKENWFISVDVSRLEQNCGVQHVDKQKAGDQLALPWVTDNHSIDEGSPSLPPKIVPFDPKVSNVGEITILDSLKDCQKYTEKDRPFNNEASSKKRTHAVQNDGLPEDESGSGPPVKKKRKTQKKEPTVKASEILGNENTIISNNKLSENSSVHDQVATVVPWGVVDTGAETPLKNAGASENFPDVSMVLEMNIQQEVPSEVSQKDKDKELVQKTVEGSEIPSSSMRTSDCEPDTSALSHQKGAKSSTQHKAAEKEVAATSSITTQHNLNTDATVLSKKDLGSTVTESAVVETHNLEKDMETSVILEPEGKLPARKKGVKKPAAKDKNGSLVKGADNIVSETSLIVPATDLSKKDLGSTAKESAVVETDNHEKDKETSVIQEPEVKLPARKKRVKKAAAENKDESLVKGADAVVETDNPENDKETSVMQEPEVELPARKKRVKKPAAKNKDESLVKGDDTIVETDNHEKVKETSVIQEPEVKLPARTKRVKKTAAENKDESLVKGDDNIVSEASLIVPATTVDEKINAETKNDKVSLSNAEKNEGLEKTLTDDVTMQEAETSKPAEVVVETSKPTEVVVETSKEDLIDVVGSGKTKEDAGISATRTDASTVTNSEMKESQDITSIDASYVDHVSKNDIVTNNVSEMSKTEKTTSQVNAEGIYEKSEKQNGKMDDKKVDRKKRKTKKSANKGEGSMSTAVSVPPLNAEAIDRKTALLLAEVDQMRGENKHVYDEGLVKKAKKSHKSSVTTPEDLPSKRQFTEPEVEPGKSQHIDHQTSKNLTVSEVSKNKDDVDGVNISKDGSHEIDFLKSFTPGKDTTKPVKEKKPKKTKKTSLVDSRNDSDMQSKKIASKNENQKASTNVVKGSIIPNTDQFKTPKKISKIDAHANKAHGKPSAEFLLNQKSNKQQPTLSQSSFKNVQKSALVKNSSQHIKSLVNKPKTIFGGDSDESSADDNAAANSDSSTRTPSGRSSSGDSAASIDSTRKGSHADKRKSVGKDSMNSQSKSKSMSMADLLRSSSRFKRAKVSASQQAWDAESQSVDFVPDSQPQ